MKIPMEIYYPSRRQDLLVGSFVSTLLVSAAFWLGNGAPPVLAPHLQAFNAPPPPINRNQDTLDDQEGAEDIRTGARQDMAPPDIPDVPRPLTPSSIPQQIEPALPGRVVDTFVIPERPGSGPGSRIFTPTQLDQQPEILVQARPSYPTALRQAGVGGEVVVDFVVDRGGVVRNVSAVRSTNREFEDSAIAAVSKWKFRAGMKDGRSVATHMQVPIEFFVSSN
jgi:periplasmic protein TonB